MKKSKEKWVDNGTAGLKSSNGSRHERNTHSRSMIYTKLIGLVQPARKVSCCCYFPLCVQGSLGGTDYFGTLSVLPWEGASVSLFLADVARWPF